MGEGAADEELDGFAIGDGLQAFEEIGPGVETIHLLELFGFVVESF